MSRRAIARRKRQRENADAPAEAPVPAVEEPDNEEPVNEDADLGGDGNNEEPVAEVDGS